jgi:hypothetical protein
MKGRKLSFERFAELSILALSVISLLMGLILSLVYIVSIISCNDNTLCNHVFGETDLKLIAILIIGGLLGSVLDFVLKKIVKEHIKKYIDEGTLDDLLSTIIEENESLEKEEDEEAKKEEENPRSELDTVIVPVAKSYASVLKNREYRCPAERALKAGIKYIAFYKNKEVIGVGEIQEGYPKKEGGDQVFKFKYTSLSIPHNKKGAFVQNRLYCTYENLLKASNTDEI